MWIQVNFFVFSPFCRRNWNPNSFGCRTKFMTRVNSPSFPGGSDSKKIASFQPSPWVGKMPWRKTWEPMPVFLPRESSWTEEHGRLWSMGWQSQTRLRDWAQYDFIIWSFDNHCLPGNFFAGNFLSLGSQSETGHTDLFFSVQFIMLSL